MRETQVTVRLAWGAVDVLLFDTKLDYYVDRATAARFQMSLQRGARCVMLTGTVPDLVRLASNVGLLTYDGSVNPRAQRTAGIVSRRIEKALRDGGHPSNQHELAVAEGRL